MTRSQSLESVAEPNINSAAVVSRGSCRPGKEVAAGDFDSRSSYIMYPTNVISDGGRGRGEGGKGGCSSACPELRYHRFVGKIGWDLCWPGFIQAYTVAFCEVGTTLLHDYSRRWIVVFGSLVNVLRKVGIQPL